MFSQLYGVAQKSLTAFKTKRQGNKYQFLSLINYKTSIKGCHFYLCNKISLKSTPLTYLHTGIFSLPLTNLRIIDIGNAAAEFLTNYFL